MNPEIWEEVPPNVASAAREHPTPFPRVKIELFSYANELLIGVGVAGWGGGAGPKMWAEICVGLLRNETRLEESLFWPNESVFF